MRRRIFACLLVLGFMLHAPDARSDDERARAIEHFERGNRYLAEGALDAALAELTRSRELLKTRGNTLNLAIVLQRLERYDEALVLYRELLNSFSLEVADKARVEEEIDSLSKRVGTLVLECEPDARVYIDGRERGTTPLTEPLLVSAGSRVVRVIKPGRIPFEERIVMTGGRERKLRIELSQLVERVVVREHETVRTAAPPATTPEDSLRVGWGATFAGFVGNSLGGPLAASCGSDCDASLPFGYGFDVHGGLVFNGGIELSALLGWLSLRASYSGRDDSVDVGGAQRGTSDDELRLSGVLLGARTSVTRGRAPFVRFALSAGGLFAKVRDERRGDFTIEPASGSPYPTELDAERSVTGNYLFVLPEVSLGWHLTEDLDASAGLGFLALFALTTPRWPDKDGLLVTGGPSDDIAYPESEALTGSLLGFVTPRFGVSGTF